MSGPPNAKIPLGPPAPRELALLCVSSARDHLQASKTLNASGQSNFATFHLITALEELAKARLVGPAMAQLSVSLGWSEDPAMKKTLRKFGFFHDPKIAVAAIMILVQSAPLAATRHPNFTKGLTADEVSEIKERQIGEIGWMVANLLEVEDVRERAIYAGPDRAGSLPAELGWKEYVTHLTPLIEDQVEFAEWAVPQEMSPVALEKLKSVMEGWRRQLESASKGLNVGRPEREPKPAG